MSFSVISFEGLTFFFFVNLLGLINYYYLSITFKTLCKVYWLNDSVIVVIKVNIDKTLSLEYLRLKIGAIMVLRMNIVSITYIGQQNHPLSLILPMLNHSTMI
jgi:hypothetical protein